jgi:microcystin-dependent protein
MNGCHPPPQKPHPQSQQPRQPQHCCGPRVRLAQKPYDTTWVALPAGLPPGGIVYISNSTGQGPEVYYVDGRNQHYAFDNTMATADKVCKDLNAVVATSAQLQAAWEKGADWCNTGTVNMNGTSRGQFPINDSVGAACSPTKRVATMDAAKRGVNCYGLKPASKEAVPGYDIYGFRHGIAWNQPNNTAVVTTPPEGFLECNGAKVLKSTYPALYSAIRSLYGPEDATTFTLPDLRGVFLRGADLGRGLDPNRVLGSYQEDGYKSHTHAAGAAVSTGGESNCQGWTPSTTQAANSFRTSDRAGRWLDSTNLNQATGGSETRPKNVAMTAYIKY